jgi:hypothetical protein
MRRLSFKDSSASLRSFLGAADKGDDLVGGAAVEDDDFWRVPYGDRGWGIHCGSTRIPVVAFASSVREERNSSFGWYI